MIEVGTDPVSGECCVTMKGDRRRPLSLRLLGTTLLAAATICLPHASVTAEIPDKTIRTQLDVPDDIDLITPQDLQQAHQLEESIKRAAAKALPSVVGLRINLPGSVRGGTGTIISPDGYILTAAHVIEEPGRRCWIYLADGTVLRGRTLGQHMEGPIDYGLVKCDTKGQSLPSLSLGNSDAVQQGQWVLSLGHTLGIETSPFRPPSVRAGRVMTNFGPLVETDATLNGGDSGGPLIDLHGNIVGVNVATGDSPDENSSTAVNITKNFLERLKADIRLGRELWPSDFGAAIASAYELLDQKRFTEAQEAFQECIDDQPHLGDGYYHLACCYVRQGLNANNEDDQRQLHSLALDTLSIAAERGWSQFSHIASDPDMHPIRTSRRFQDILNIVRRNCGQQASLGVDGVAGDDGIRVTRLDPFGGARACGVERNDLILSVDGQRLRSFEELRAIELSYRPNDEVVVTVSRDGERRTFNCTMGGRWPQTNYRRRVSKDSSVFLEAMSPKAKEISESTVPLRADGKRIGYGLVVHADGLVVGKYSDVSIQEAPIQIVAPNGMSLSAELVAHDSELDLALLECSASDLTPVIFATGPKPDVGSLLFSVSNEDAPISVGVRSLDDYVSTIGRSDQPFLGVVLARGHDAGVAVISVRNNTGASYAGLLPRDVITAVDGVPVATRQELISKIRDCAVGDQVEISFTREGVDKKVKATLGRLPGVGAEAGGAPRRGHRALSRRTSGFGKVIQHDGIVYPNQCGSALVDLDGRVVGMNIARADQTKTYALPADVLQEATKRLIREASKQSK